ncbi:MAG TPA: amidohydrolase family protein, partial [Chthonomonadaceae bacterium]|nr:amidohydrolase family protein [Chthonomonadaceae bacterium]
RSADPVFLNRLLSAYPRLSLILAMPANTSRESLLPLLDVARRHRNLVFDLAAGSGQHGLISWLAGQVGASQIVFGSGFPLHHFAYPLGRVQFSDLSDRDRARILYENAARLFYTHRK